MVKKIIKMGAQWCGPCKAFSKTFENVSKMDEYKDIEFKELDIDEDDATDMVEKFQVRSVPTIVLLNDNDELVSKVIGNVKESDFIKIINDAMAQ